MERGDESSRGHSRVPVHDGLLHVSLNGLQHHWVGDRTESSDSGSSVAILLSSHVLGQGGRHDDHILCDSRQLLDPEVDQSSEDCITSLEQLGDCKKAFRSFRRSQSFPLIYQVENFGQNCRALSRVNRGLIEQPEQKQNIEPELSTIKPSSSFTWLPGGRTSSRD